MMEKVRDFVLSLPKGIWLAILVGAALLFLLVIVKAAYRNKEKAEERNHYLYYSPEEKGWRRYTPGINLDLRKRVHIHNEPERKIAFEVFPTDDGHASWYEVKYAPGPYEQGKLYEHPKIVAEKIATAVDLIVRTVVNRGGDFARNRLGDFIEEASDLAAKNGVSMTIVCSMNVDAMFSSNNAD